MKDRFNAILDVLDEWLWPESWREDTRVCMTCLLIGQCFVSVIFLAIIVAS